MLIYKDIPLSIKSIYHLIGRTARWRSLGLRPSVLSSLLSICSTWPFRLRSRSAYQGR